MVEAQRQRFQSIVNGMWSQGKIVALRPLTGGMSARVVRVDVEVNGLVERVVVRWYEGWDDAAAVATLDKAFRVLETAREAGVRVPRPYLLSRDGAGFGTPYSVVEFVAGEMVFAPADLDSYIDQYATQLAGIHQVDVEGFDLGFLPVVGGRPVARPEVVNDDLSEGKIREVLANTDIEPVRNKKVLLHGDFWPGNLLWHEGELAAVIDWEDAAVGEPLLDFAQCRSEVAWIFGQAALEQFTVKYQSLVDVDYRALSYWDLRAALRFVRLLGQDLRDTATFFHGYGREDMTAQSIYDDYQEFINCAFDSFDRM